MASNKSIYFQIPKIENEGVVVQYDNLDHFYDQLHHHPEFQLIYILDGTGNLFVGDSITAFEAGNLFLFGSNQSHILKSDPKFFRSECKENSRSISIFFHQQSLGDGFFDISETTAIKDLINRADRSLAFAPTVASAIGQRMKELVNESGFDRFLETLSILNKLALTDQYRFLASVAN